MAGLIGRRLRIGGLITSHEIVQNTPLTLIGFAHRSWANSLSIGTAQLTPGYYPVEAEKATAVLGDLVGGALIEPHHCLPSSWKGRCKQIVSLVIAQA